MYKIQDYILKFDHPNKKILFKDEFKKFFGNINILERVNMNTFSKEYYFKFSFNALDISESMFVNKVLDNFESYSLKNNQIFKIVESLSANLFKYNIFSHEAVSLNSNLFESEFQRLNGYNRNYYELIINNKCYRFFEKHYGQLAILVEKKLHFDETETYWRYNFILYTGVKSGFKFNVFYKYSKLFRQNIYYLNIHKFHSDKPIKSVYSVHFFDFETLLESIELQSENILKKTFVNNIKKVLGSDIVVDDSNLEDYKNIINLTLY